MSAISVRCWNIFKRDKRAKQIAQGLERIPAHWSLTPLQDKQPKRNGWEKEAFIPHDQIADFILHGKELISQKGNPYTAFWSGFGLRTGEPSGGLIAIDIDGPSAEPILDAISGGDLPKTVSWTSGKVGRSQILYQIPEQYRQALSEFTRVALTQWDGLKTDGKDLLEFRYNNVQSVLPPSRHPETGSYRFLNAPDEIPVAIAPVWLCNLLLSLAEKQASDRIKQQLAAARQAVQWAEHKKEYEKTGIATDLVSFLEYEVLPRLSPEQIFNWSGHHFQQFGNTWKGCPPWRHSSSGTSFHVWWDGSKWAWQDKATTEGGGAIQYRWKLRGGTGTPRGKDFVDIVEELARDAGVVMPERTTSKSEPEILYTQYLEQERSQQEWEQQCDRYSVSKKLESILERALSEFRKLVLGGKKKKDTKPLTEVSVKKPVGATIYFEPGEHLATLKKLANQSQEENKPYIILDRSEMGSGKSHLAGELNPEDLGVNKLFLATHKHRNPTVASIEAGYHDLVVRNNGLVADPRQQTPLGFPHIRWPKPGEEPNIPGNCPKTKQFHILSAKGYYQEVEVEAKLNPICATCPFLYVCRGKDASGRDVPRLEGSSYRRDRQSGLQLYDKIRASLVSIPILDAFKKPLDGDDNLQERRVGLIVDEFEEQFKYENLIEVTINDFDTGWAYLQQKQYGLENESKKLEHQLDALKTDIALLKVKIDEAKEVLRKSSLATQLSIVELEISDSPTDEFVVLREDLEKDEAIYDKLLVRAITLKDEIEELQQQILDLLSIIEVLKPIVFSIRPLLLGGEKLTQETYHGYSEAMVRDRLGELPDLEVAIAVLQKAAPNLSELLTKIDTVTLDGVEGSAADRKQFALTIKFARSVLLKESATEVKEGIYSLPPNWLLPFIEVLAKSCLGSFRIKNRTLTVMVKNDRTRDIIKSADFVWIADATLTREALARALDIDPDEIIVIKKKPSNYQNLTITQITGMGLLGKERSASSRARVKALRTAIEELHGVEDTAVIDRKASKEETDGHWFCDNRGSNLYQHKKALLTLGDPYQDIGYLQMLYTTLSGDRNPSRENPDFNAFVNEKMQAEVIQAGGRLRAFRRTGEELNLYIVTETDLSYLHEYFPGAKFVKKSAFEITPEAGDATEQSRALCLEATKRILERGEELTTVALAKEMGRDRTRVSQLAKQVAGGWDSFRRVLAALIKAIYRTTHTSTSWFDGLTEDEIFAARTYLPLTLDENPTEPLTILEEASSLMEALGIEAFERVMQALPLKYKGVMLGDLISLLHIDWQKRFLSLYYLHE
ncbi:MAG: bifunctional DNA primase/polymerase [Scytonema sp. PMC 1069.18]|nr:bifunctional DNA primase/polymerase [Scytonema sp. PMC 1069.18]MEC4886036.1 bifunctional DNA primase/polymerase [Scytonema sp. PMC 1070.18]